MRPIAPNPIVVLGPESKPAAQVKASPKTIQWDPSAHGVTSRAVVVASDSSSPRVASGPLLDAAVVPRFLRSPEPGDRGLTSVPFMPQGHEAPFEWGEEAETMRSPEGATEGVLIPGHPPSGQIGARIVMTRMSRDLGRHYRERYGLTLTVDAAGIDAMQHHLVRRLHETSADGRPTAALEAELTGHGAFLSEVLARRLGAIWLEVGGPDPADWVMGVGAGIRVWPVWRVHNFLRQTWHGPGALSSFYAQLRARLLER